MNAMSHIKVVLMDTRYEYLLRKNIKILITFSWALSDLSLVQGAFEMVFILLEFLSGL